MSVVGGGGGAVEFEGTDIFDEDDEK